MSHAPNEDSLKMTNEHAVSAKLSAVTAGFYRDDYLQYFCSSHRHSSAPEINIGYYLRYAAIKQLSNKFFDRSNHVGFQIINIGSGFDTLYWRLLEDNVTNFVIFDIDLESIILKKTQIIEQQMALWNLLDDPYKDERDLLQSRKYHFLGSNLVDLDLIIIKLKVFETFSYEVPTLVISECVLTYLEEVVADRLLRWMSSSFTSLLIINYDLANMTDSFGEVMFSHLAKLYFEVSDRASCVSLETQLGRFGRNEFEGWNGLLMSQIRDKLSGQIYSENRSVRVLDETEVLQQMLDHYCICWAHVGDQHKGLEF